MGRIIAWNKGAESIFGYSAEEVVGRPISLLVPPARLSEESDILERLRKGDRVDRFETVRMAKDGRMIDVSLTISPIKDAEGTIVGASKIARDITQQKKSDQMVRQAQEELRLYAEELEKKVLERTARLQESLAELEAFSYTISHDLRAPLRAIQGLAQVVLEDYGEKLGPHGGDLLSRIVESGNRLHKLIEAVLSYSRLGRDQIELKPVLLEKIVAQVIEEYPNIKEAKAGIKIDSPLLPVRAHEPLLVQCLSNLLGNAVKFVAPGTAPDVRLWTERKSAEVRLWVEDHGIGIAPDEQRKLFTLFSRVGDPRQYEGSGVGLAIVQRGVSRMGGTVGVESEMGKGSRFWIQLAAAEEPTPSRASATG